MSGGTQIHAKYSLIMIGPLAEGYKDKGGSQCYGLKHFLGRETQEK